MFKKMITLAAISLFASSALAGELTSFELKGREARFCGTKKVLLNSERFNHPSTSRIINLIGENDILDGFKMKEVVCGSGSYRIDDRGIVGHVYVYIDEVHSEDEE